MIARHTPLAVAMLAALTLVGSTDAQTYEAVAIEGDALLRVPADLRDQVGKSFDVAPAPPRIDFVRMNKLPDKGKGTLWSTWGDGCVASSGLYYTSIGDHLGVDSTSHVYAYNPDTRKLRLVLDVAEALNQKPGVYGHGKIHSGMHEGPEGGLWFATYWGKHREIEDHFGKGGFEGSILMRLNPKTGGVENLGAIVPRQGLPASHYVPEHRLLCMYAVYDNDLVVYDVSKRKRVFLGGAGVIKSNRAMMHDAKGRVYVSDEQGVLHRYDPATNKLAPTKARLDTLPTGSARKGSHTLRAAIPTPTPDGKLYGMTAGGRLFAFDPEAETIKDLGPNFADGMYTAVMMATPKSAGRMTSRVACSTSASRSSSRRARSPA